MNIISSVVPYITQKRDLLVGDAKYQRSKSNNLAPLAHDTVSFKGRKQNTQSAIKEVLDIAKKKDIENEEKSNKIPYKVACAINKELEPQKDKLMTVLKEGLKDLVVSDEHPDNPIAKGHVGIHGRVKSPESIMEKIQPRALRTKKEILQLGDVIGGRIVLDSSSPADFDKVFKALGEMVKAGKLNVVEVENYRLSPKDSYVAQSTLDDFEDTCQSVGQYPSVQSKPRESGYTAVHVTLDLGNGILAELQIMGRDMERVKELEDFIYKKSCNKKLPKKYRKIEKMLDNVLGPTNKMEKLTGFQKETLQHYTRDCYVYAREMPVRERRRRESSKNFFYPIPYSLPQELSFENLEKMKEECDKEWKNSKNK